MGANAVSNADSRGTKVVYGLLGEERFLAEADYARRLPPFQDLRDSDIVEFLYRLGLEALGGRPKIFSLEQAGELAYRAHQALTLGLEAAERWPDAFYEILDRMRRRSASTVKAGLRKYVLPVERWLEGLPEYRGGTLREAVFTYKQAAVAASEEQDHAPSSAQPAANEDG